MKKTLTLLMVLCILSCATQEKLYRAIDEGSIEKAKDLIERGCDINAGYMTMNFPEVAMGNPEMLQFLIDSGARVDNTLFSEDIDLHSAKVLLDNKICMSNRQLSKVIKANNTGLIKIVLSSDCSNTDQIKTVYSSVLAEDVQVSQRIMRILNPDHDNIYSKHLLKLLRETISEKNVAPSKIEYFMENFPSRKIEFYSELFEKLPQYKSSLDVLLDLHRKKPELGDEEIPGLVAVDSSLEHLWHIRCVVQMVLPKVSDDKTIAYFAAPYGYSGIIPSKWVYSSEKGVHGEKLSQAEIKEYRKKSKRGYLDFNYAKASIMKAMKEIGKTNENYRPLPFDRGFVLEEPRENAIVTSEGSYSFYVISTGSRVGYNDPDTGFPKDYPVFEIIRDPAEIDGASSVKAFYKYEVALEKHEQELKEAQKGLSESLELVRPWIVNDPKEMREDIRIEKELQDKTAEEKIKKNQIQAERRAKAKAEIKRQAEEKRLEKEKLNKQSEEAKAIKYAEQKRSAEIRAVKKREEEIAQQREKEKRIKERPRIHLKIKFNFFEIDYLYCFLDGQKKTTVTLDPVKFGKQRILEKTFNIDPGVHTLRFDLKNGEENELQKNFKKNMTYTIKIKTTYIMGKVKIESIEESPS